MTSCGACKPRIGLDRARQLEAVHAGHLHVEDDEVERLSARAARWSRSSASAPLAACSSRIPQLRRDGAGTARLVALSSTMSTRRPASAALRGGGLARPQSASRKRAVNQKVEPLPGSLSTPISPPICSTSCLQIASPRPVPPYLRVVEPSACTKAWKSLSCASGGMPMPVSRHLEAHARGVRRVFRRARRGRRPRPSR